MESIIIKVELLILQTTNKLIIKRGDSYAKTRGAHSEDVSIEKRKSKMTRCRVSKKDLIEVINFDKQPLGNGFLKEQEFEKEYFYNMKVGFEESSCMLQLIDQPTPESMFHDEYAFFSSTSKHMTKHFKEWANEI